MIVYNLACDQNHPFEGWFSSPIDFENQRDRGLVECPICGSKTVERKLHAPRINVGAAPSNREQAVESATQADGDIDTAKLAQAVAGFVKGVRENTEYVGEKFAEEARAMHYGEKPHKGIRGRADKETARELREEGIEFQSLPFPVDFPNSH
ncbi:MAG: DUF1178 family protein [Betaproteobacteria bacterium]|nr:MAG: DUF1178 family protein [Betaproteobacteria bacterium]